LTPAVGRRGERFLARLDPSDRSAELSGEPNRHQVLRERGALPPERAADGRDHHADQIGIERERGREMIAQTMRGLMRAPHGEPVAGSWRHHDAARLDRCRDHASDRHGQLEADLRPREGRQRLVAEHAVVDDVRGQVEEGRRSGTGGAIEPDHRLERIEVEHDELGRVVGVGCLLGGDHGDRLPDEPDAIDRERRAIHRMGPGAARDERHRRQVGQIDGGDRRHHARHPPGRAEIDASHEGVRLVAANEPQVDAATGSRQIGHEPRLAGQQVGILDTEHRRSDHVHAPAGARWRTSASATTPGCSTLTR